METRKTPLDKKIKKDYRTMSSGEMAKKYGVTRTTVCRHLRRLGITRPISGINSRNRKRYGEVVKNGYPVIHLPNHKRATAIGYVFKHILEMEKKIGKTPTRSKPIHHIDIDRMNYAVDNLYLCKSHSQHKKLHGSLNRLVKPLLERGVIKFNRKKGIYEL